MFVLALDTSTATVVAGVVAFDAQRTDPAGATVLAARLVDNARGHAEILTTLILDCLTEAAVARTDLGAVVVGCGPGPFTGLRVGMATAAAFADALDLPLHGVCSLDAIAAVAGAGGSRVAVITDARRREVYWATYTDGRRVAGPAVSAPADLTTNPEIVAATTVLGSPDHAALVTDVPATAAAPTPAGLVEVAASALRSGVSESAVVPLYLRRPDAVEPKDRAR
ncbi:tRNA (adenosine(37)-N6)-threonylcarbamoyltransferase complex dimerization subunit type 1 TsaB [Williamsia sp. CHRR-6]|uniref:tRNA (adenosine(37)-N6)-threonylcarbamoyltransferase complex dimerization subunit type 1 TsaB n=1 Tax=Williamsia sp. CHRR-6 TaxID=2835871 RepID=UPI001BDA779E|nr:tRNA (adenosine(37)-N6)-threonylcarbamoyltransferase complex dimerization subunit type 1 TsaB [Williamsia sp. CHRR-6]MBT0566751.1 tRNA (adenosine(37)-N6)-threonylcarbamoyltransferase complex dimerization subunit type 1 TsaB [Williamsia sp. CHRR-6]